MNQVRVTTTSGTRDLFCDAFKVTSEGTLLITSGRNQYVFAAGFWLSVEPVTP
jgi:hypothetical protein